MPTSIKSVIDQALRKLRLVAAGEQADPTEYADGLMTLRQMLDTWSLEDLLIPFHPTEAFALDPQRYFYSVGSFGDWDTVRPEQVLSLRIQDAGGQSYPLVEQGLRARELQANVQIGRPSVYMVQRDARFVFIEFNCYPEPGLTALLTTLKPFNVTALDNFDTTFDPATEPQTIWPSGFTLTGIQTAIDFPPGYEQAIVSNLAIHMAPEYGREAPPTVIGEAANAKTLIKRRNKRRLTTTIDPALTQRRGFYDIVAGP